MIDPIISAVLITGGTLDSGEIGNFTELFIPFSNTTCRLPDLQEPRDYHSQDNLILCGGTGLNENMNLIESVSTGCVHWNSSTGSWEELLRFDQWRSGHVSWSPGPDVGTFLMGGQDKFGSPLMTTTLIKPDHSQEPGFPLKYTTK